MKPAALRCKLQTAVGSHVQLSTDTCCPPARGHSSSSVGSHCTLTRSLKDGACSVAAVAAQHQVHWVTHSPRTGTVYRESWRRICSDDPGQGCRGKPIGPGLGEAQQWCKVPAVDAAGEAGLAMSRGGMPAAVPSDSPTMLPARLWFASPPNAVGDSKVVTAGWAVWGTLMTSPLHTWLHILTGLADRQAGHHAFLEASTACT